MKKTKVLEVTQIDLVGKRYNGYDMIHDLDSNKFDIKQTVIEKLSDDEKVINLIHNPGEQIFTKDGATTTTKKATTTTKSTTSYNPYADLIITHEINNGGKSLVLKK